MKKYNSTHQLELNSTEQSEYKKGFLFLKSIKNGNLEIDILFYFFVTRQRFIFSLSPSHAVVY